MLLEKGAKIDSQSNKGLTALMWAVRRGNFKIVVLLIKKGANVYMNDFKGIV